MKNYFRNYWLDGLLIIFLFALSYLFFSEVIFPEEDQFVFGADLYAQHYPIGDFAFKSYRQGQLPLWNPYLFLGFPQFAEPQFSTFYPPMWLAAQLPIGTAFALLLAMHFGLAASGGYVLVRELGGRRSGALLTGIVLGFNSFMVTRVTAGHIAPIMTISYLPWCLAAAHWSIRRPLVMLFLPLYRCPWLC